MTGLSFTIYDLDGLKNVIILQFIAESVSYCKVFVDHIKTNQLDQKDEISAYKSLYFTLFKIILSIT